MFYRYGCLAHDMSPPDTSHIRALPGQELKNNLWRNVERHGTPVARLHLQSCNREWARVVHQSDPLYYAAFCPAPNGFAVQRQALGQMQVDEMTELSLRELSCLDVPNQAGVEYYAKRLRDYGPIFVNVYIWGSIFPPTVTGATVDARLTTTGDDLYVLLPQNCLLRNVFIIHPKARQYEVHPRIHIHEDLPPLDDGSDTASQVSTTSHRWDTVYSYDFPTTSRTYDNAPQPQSTSSRAAPQPHTRIPDQPLQFVETSASTQSTVMETVLRTQTVNAFFLN